MSLIDIHNFDLTQLTHKVNSCTKKEDMFCYLKEIRTISDAFPKSSEVLALVAKIYHILDDNKTAFRYYCRAQQYGRDNMDYVAWVFITSLLCKNNHWQSFKDSVFKEKSNLYELAKGEYYFSMGQYIAAMEIAQNLYQKEPNNFDICSLFARCLDACEEKNFEKISLILNSNWLLLTSDLGVSILLKALHRDKNDYECKKQCKKIIAQNPNSTAAEIAQNILQDYKKEDSVHQASNNLASAIRNLNDLIGLKSVKEQIERLQRMIEYNRLRKERLGIEDDGPVAYHFVFTGNPGTGKTTVARLLCDIFYHLSLLEKNQLVETDRSGLVGQYVGETAQKTQKLIEKAMGGVLFIDEAYALHNEGNSNDFGTEAIETLIKAMEDKRGQFIVILAGYTDEMHHLMKSNPGLQSRFNKFIEFPDYTNDELLAIAKQAAYKHHYFINEDGEKAFLERIEREKIDDKFGNARTVRNIMNEAFEEKANVQNVKALSEEELTSLSAKDFGVNVDLLPEAKAAQYIDSMDQLIGLGNVKKEINSLIKMIKYQKAETASITEIFCHLNMHMIFMGNPGTGKTTVARLFGKILKELGVLRKGQLVEVTRADLVGQWLGHTAKLTREKCQQAYGGMLFIDEAYSLCYSPDDAYGKEAIDTIIKEMEDNRDKLVIILAGYTANMEQLLLTNPGFSSRITKKIEFVDYTPEEMLQIFKRFADNEKFLVANGCDEQLLQMFGELYEKRDENFGNGRDVRKIFEVAKMNLICRVQDNALQGKDRRIILLQDLK